jgi:iron complex outermembrane receptor protein
MEQVVGISKGTGSMLSFHKVGYAPYTYYPYQQLYDSNGNPIQNAFVDRDGDGKITELDRYESGKSPIPGFYYGLNLKLSYKDWDFGINGHGNADYWIFNDFASANSTSSFDVNSALLPNFATVVKRTGFTKPNEGYQYYSDLFLENASFFRLDDVNLGYTFRDVSDYNGTIRVAFSAQNVFVITKYSGIDPEIQGGNNGIDNVIWPRPRTYSIRVNFTF